MSRAMSRTKSRTRTTTARTARTARQNSSPGRSDVERLEPRLVLSGYSLGALASFAPAPAGYDPEASLVRDSAGDLFGTTYSGGAHDQGTVFEIAAGTTAVTALASFHGPDGANPVSAIAIDASGNLYGTTQNGGASGVGTVFELAKGTSAVTTLVSFATSNGANPLGGVVLDSAGILYGTTSAGGSFSEGTVFSFNPLSVGPAAVNTLVSFNNTNGSTPEGNLVLDASGNLFGAGGAGGTNNLGTVFEIAKGTNAATTLATFNGSAGTANGSHPLGGVVADSSGNLYGTTDAGGTSGGGTLFEVAKGTSAVTVLAQFNGTNGSESQGTVAVDAAGTVYGVTSAGGANGLGTVFKHVKGASTVTTLVTFAGSTDGSTPVGGVILDSAGNLYGTTSKAGGVNSQGTVFKLAPGATSVTTLAALKLPDGAYPDNGVVLDSAGNLWGTTQTGGPTDDGRVFEVAKGTTAVTFIATFNGANGSDPMGGVAFDSAGNLYGTTSLGGANNLGGVYEIAKGTTTVTLLASFNTNNGDTPVGDVVLDSAGNLFGAAQTGGANGFGGIFEVAKGTKAITLLASFNNNNGAYPTGVTLDANGNLFGTANTGGDTNNDGGVWEIAKGTKAITTLALFNASNGSEPVGRVALDSSGNLFGVTQAGGDSNNDGAVFEVAAGTKAITALALFGSGVGINPAGGVALDANGNLFGTAQYGGDTNDDGVAWEVVKGSKTLTPLVLFDGVAATNPAGSVALDAAGNLYGTAPLGGAANTGSVFVVSKASAVAFLQAPTNAFAGAPISPPVKVAVQDSAGNTLLADTSIVTLTLTGGTFADGTTTATAQAVNGVATFSNLIINAVGSFSLTPSDAAYALTGSAAPFTVSGDLGATSVGITDNPTAATVTTSSQRSQVRGLVFTFASPNPSFSTSQLSLSVYPGSDTTGTPTAVTGVFGTPVAVAGSNNTQWILPFISSTANTSASGSLNDGIYLLSISNSSGVTPLTFHRLYGDMDGNKTVNPADYAKIKTAFGSSTGQSAFNADLDYDNNGTINAADYAQFKTRFGKTFSYT